MNTLGAYRGLKRLTSVATFLLFGVSLIVGYLYLDKTSDLWTIAKWSGICAPVVVTLLILALLGVGWWAPVQRDSREPIKIRVPAALWVLIGIEIPWILAWLGADAMSSWWQHIYAAMPAAPYLWGVRLMSWLVTYALASALGVLVTILVDIRMAQRRATSPK